MAQLDRLKIHLDEDNDALLLDILTCAKAAIINKRYPFGNYDVDEFGEAVLDSMYSDLQIRIAIYLYNKRGAEGQLTHDENGINRTYESADVPSSMLRVIVPKVGVFG